MKHSHRNRWLFGLTSLFGLVTAAPGFAGTITFDDITSGQIAGIPTNYGGLNWTQMGVWNASTYPGNGYYQSLHSGDYVAYSTTDVTSGFNSTAGTFTFNSAYFSSGFNDGMIVDVIGLNGGVPLYSTPMTLNTTAGTFATFNYANIDEVEFVVITPGTQDPNLPYSGFGSQFGMDDLVINGAITTAAPVPPSGLLAGLGGLSLLGYRRRGPVVA